MTKTNPNRAKRILSIVGIYFLGLASLELLGQLAIKYFETKHTSGIFAENLLNHEEPLVGFGLRKNLKERMGGWTTHTNALGFRHSENLQIPKPAEECRIFVVGGSTVFGWGVNDDETIPAYLQNLIQERNGRFVASQGKKIRVINAGVPWYASWHEASLIFFRLLSLEPDWIIVLDGLNDTAFSLQPSWAPIHLGGYIDLPTRIASERRKATSHGESFLIELLKVSPTFRYFHAKLKARKELQEGTYHPEVWDQYSHYMQWLSQLTSRQGIRFSVFMQPVLVLDKTLDPFEVSTHATGMVNPRFAETFRRTYLDGEKVLLATHSFRFNSLRQAFKEMKEWIYLDGLHYNPKGNQILARRIFDEEIAPNLSLTLSKMPHK